MMIKKRGEAEHRRKEGMEGGKIKGRGGNMEERGEVEYTGRRREEGRKEEIG